MSDESDNVKMGCATALIVVLNLAMAIYAVVQLSGFWRCTGAFLTFLIGGSIGGLIGMGIGMGVAKVKEDTFLGVSAPLIGVLFGSICCNIGLGRWWFNLDFLRLLQG